MVDSVEHIESNLDFGYIDDSGNPQGNEIRNSSFERMSSFPITGNFKGRKISLVDGNGNFISDFTCVSLDPDKWKTFIESDDVTDIIKLTQAEYDEITEYALDLGLENAFVQEIESQTACLPDFEQVNPFNFA